VSGVTAQRYSHAALAAAALRSRNVAFAEQLLSWLTTKPVRTDFGASVFEVAAANA
jgi:hypothetical protein